MVLLPLHPVWWALYIWHDICGAFHLGTHDGSRKFTPMSGGVLLRHRTVGRLRIRSGCSRILPRGEPLLHRGNVSRLFLRRSYRCISLHEVIVRGGVRFRPLWLPRVSEFSPRLSFLLPAASRTALLLFFLRQFLLHLGELLMWCSVEWLPLRSGMRWRGRWCALLPRLGCPLQTRRGRSPEAPCCTFCDAAFEFSMRKHVTNARKDRVCHRSEDWL